QFRPLRSDADACHPLVESTHLRFKCIPLFQWNILLERVQILRWNSIDDLYPCRPADKQDMRRLRIRVDSDRYSRVRCERSHLGSLLCRADDEGVSIPDVANGHDPREVVQSNVGEAHETKAQHLLRQACAQHLPCSGLVQLSHTDAPSRRSL